MRRAGHGSGGYTIVEVMVFLAVSGFMFLMAAAFITGKQGKAEFQQGIHDAGTQFQTIINDVGNGFFSLPSGLNCPYSASATLGAQGTNQGCVFMGKVIQFAPAGNPGGYDIYSIAGRQYVTSAADGTVPTSFSQAAPVNISSATPEQHDLEWGLQFTKAYDLHNSQDLSGVGFFTSFGHYSSGGLDSGSQSTIVLPIKASTSSGLGENVSQMNGDMGTWITDAHVDPNPNILLCFDGGKGQYGTLIIGGGGTPAGTGSQRLTTTIQVYVNAASWHAVGC